MTKREWQERVYKALHPMEAGLIVGELFDHFEQQLKDKDKELGDWKDIQQATKEANVRLNERIAELETSDTQRFFRIKHLEAELQGFKNSLEWDEYKNHCECKSKLKRYENPVAEFEGAVDYDGELSIKNGGYIKTRTFRVPVAPDQQFSVIVLEVGEL